MENVKVDKKELLEIVLKNRETHITQFEESLSDYKAAVIKVTTDNVKLAKSGDLEKIKQIKHIPSEPESYEQSYTRAIRMLELSVDAVITLDEYTFNNLVLDEWDWKKRFALSGSTYKSLL